MNDEDRKLVLDALTKAHVYLLHLPGRMFAPDEGDDCRKYYCFACMAASGQNHRPDCEVIALAELVGKARDITTHEFNNGYLMD